MSELRTHEISGHFYSSYLPPFITYGLVSSRSRDMEERGYNEVVIEGFGNVWVRTVPPEDAT